MKVIKPLPPFQVFTFFAFLTFFFSPCCLAFCFVTLTSTNRSKSSEAALNCIILPEVISLLYWRNGLGFALCCKYCKYRNTANILPSTTNLQRCWGLYPMRKEQRKLNEEKEDNLSGILTFHVLDSTAKWNY